VTLLCQIYRSPRRQETYLYVDRRQGLSDVPEELLESFGEPEEVMVIAMTAERKLARVSAEQVMSGIEKNGYFLQVPPSITELIGAAGSRD
jgi:uncharacterized protein YcgL (UPF0745 family)